MISAFRYKNITANKTLISNKQVKVISNGDLVSPAPLKAPPRENSIAIKGCKDPIIQIKITVNLITSASSIKNPTICSANKIINAPKIVINVIDKRIPLHADLFA